MPFTNPYLSCSTTSRVTYSVDEKDKNLLRSIRLKVGTETTVCTLLYKKFCDALRARGIVEFGQAKELEEFAVNCELSIPQKDGKRKPAKS